MTPWGDVGRVNPLEGVCCFYHAGLVFFQDVILQMMLRHCNHDVHANLGWQCQRCFTLQPGSDADSDADSDDEPEASTCELCGRERVNSDNASIVDPHVVPCPAGESDLADVSESCASDSAYGSDS
jgi:hypothetical protein